MPIYLCQPGAGASEPWKHGIQVYSTPFDMDEEPSQELPKTHAVTSNESTAQPSGDQQPQTSQQGDATSTELRAEGGQEITGRVQNTQAPSIPTKSIRRVRHAEIVLVDDVCLAFDRYWLRLRWPGRYGGFAGYIALGKIQDGVLPGNNYIVETVQEIANSNTSGGEIAPIATESTGFVADNTAGTPVSQVDARSSSVENEDFGREEDDGMRDDADEPQDNASTPSAEPFEASTTALTCLRTGIEFPSSVAMKLLAIYDDGVSPPVCSAPLPSEQVFCRICREGLHDDADEPQPPAATENDAESSNARSRDSSPTALAGQDSGTLSVINEDQDVRDPPEIQALVDDLASKGPIRPPPRFHHNANAAANPFLAPCECSGSMAFVHYLCVEQWRCRSRHPDAKHGKNCETCGAAYALKMPEARPTNTQNNNEEWLENMPLHVVEALRNPHIWWSIGAAIVCRRWLRPVAPILISPAVALYCRARRLLKKKGVSRRRWACSLCRRRARWKCVRCLRSYYCSRQCQNVSWHIVHKHVCYKPARFWLSVAVYGAVALVLFPGILRDPLMYDLAIGLIPASFYIMAILGGGIATAMKKTRGIDLRGRTFELAIVLLTSWLVFVSWGIMAGFFGSASQCYGVLGEVKITADTVHSSVLNPLRVVLLQQAQKWFLLWDTLALKAGPLPRRALCSRTVESNSGCFEYLPNGNADFFLEEFGGEKCASDLFLVSGIWCSAGFVALASYLVKQRERQRRAVRRPHQD